MREAALPDLLRNLGRTYEGDDIVANIMTIALASQERLTAFALTIRLVWPVVSTKFDS